jgi:glycosyltransferase involved in cell wall biosynthesis
MPHCTGTCLGTMKDIGIDARSLIPMRTGIGTYLGEILRHCPTGVSVDYFHLFSHHPIELPAISQAKKHVHSARWGLIWYLFECHRVINPAQLDLFWGVQGLVPLGLKPQLPVVITIHDCVHRMGIRYAPSGLYNILHRIFLPVSIRRSRKILTDSEFVAGEIHKYYQVPFAQIEVVPLGVAEFFHRANIREDETHKILSKYGVTTPFILAVGTLEPRKNLATLLRAWALLPPRMQREYSLVLVGKPGWQSASLTRELRSHPLSHRIIKTGYVPDEDLPHFYAGAEMFVFPSYYEGFGLPALEAMAAECPVVVSNTAGTKEVVDSGGILVDPYGPPEEWSRAIVRLATSLTLKTELRGKARERARAYSWDKCSKATLDCLAAVAEH